MQNDEVVQPVNEAEARSYSKAIQDLSRRLRRSRQLRLGVLIAADAFFPLALAGIHSDLGTSGPVILAVELLAGLAASSWLRRSVKQRLSSLQHFQALDELLAAKQDPDCETRQVSEAALLHLLNGITTREAEHLTSSQRQRLRDLHPRASYALATVLLQVLETICDPQAISAVEKLASGEGIAQSDFKVRTAAKACLERLEKQWNQSNLQQFASRERQTDSTTVSDADLITLVDDLEDEEYPIRKRAMQHLKMLDSSGLGAAVT